MESITEESSNASDFRKYRRRRAAPMNGHDRLPPHDFISERALIGCLLLSPNECIPKCMELLTGGAEEFYDLRHQTIYHACVCMFNELIPVDVVSLQYALKAAGKLDEVGGVTYFIECQNESPSAANLTYYTETVHDLYLLRRLIATCSELAGRAYENNRDVIALIDEAERAILSVRGINKEDHAVTIKELVRSSIDDIEAAFNSDGKITGLSTGLTDLDKLTNGLHGGEVTIIAAFPSTGKTSLAMNIAEHAAVANNLPVGVFSLEMTAKSLTTRMMCSMARVNLRDVSQGFMNQSDSPKLTSAAGKLSCAPLYIDDTAGISIYQLAAKARRMIQSHGIRLFVVDYIQLMNAVGSRRKLDSKEQELAEISNGLKAMAKEFNVPVIALSQLNDDGKLKHCRTIGEDADGVWKLEREKKDDQAESDGDYSAAEPITLWIRKQRNGPRDVPVHLTFLKTFTRFQGAAKVSEEDVPRD